MENPAAVSASERFSTLVKELAKELPGITFDYIGNIYHAPYYDDRSWRIFLPHPGRASERWPTTWLSAVLSGSKLGLPTGMASQSRRAGCITTARTGRLLRPGCAEPRESEETGDPARRLGQIVE